MVPIMSNAGFEMSLDNGSYDPLCKTCKFMQWKWDGHFKVTMFCGHRNVKDWCSVARSSPNGQCGTAAMMVSRILWKQREVKDEERQPKG